MKQRIVVNANEMFSCFKVHYFTISEMALPSLSTLDAETKSLKIGLAVGWGVCG